MLPQEWRIRKEYGPSNGKYGLGFSLQGLVRSGSRFRVLASGKLCDE